MEWSHSEARFKSTLIQDKPGNFATAAATIDNNPVCVAMEHGAP